MTDKYQSKFLNLAELLRMRPAVYPMRDDSFIKLNEALDDFSHYLFETTDFNNFHPDSEILRGTEAFCDSPVFICGAMKSGTTLCTRLLDNHPDLLVMPGDSHYANLADKWTREQFPEIATYWLHELINPSGAEPFLFVSSCQCTPRTQRFQERLEKNTGLKRHRITNSRFKC